MKKQITRNKIAIIGSVGVPANYGGFETLAEHLIEDLSGKHDLTVYCSGKKYPKTERKDLYKGARLRYIPFDANGIQSIPYDTLSILHALFYADVLLILGVAGAWILPFIRFFTNKKIIISIDGIEWKRDKWNTLAKWYLFWAESMAVKYSHIDISDNEAIQDYTAARYGTLSRIVEYGADHAAKVKVTPEAIGKYPFLYKPYAFKVCRIEPENNVHMILDAFSQTGKLPLVIVGNWDKSEYGRELKSRYADNPNIYIFNPIYNQQKLDTLRSNAFVYVHGHSAGGTNPSLVEAMYLGLPILSFGVSYNRVTTENRAIYFKNLQELIYEINTLDAKKMKDMGKTLETIARRRYTWSHIAAKYDLLIEESLETIEKADVIPDITRLSYQKLLSRGLAHMKTLNFF
jgi:glycosyltransferase involved in cell wall biosynthesis